MTAKLFNAYLEVAACLEVKERDKGAGLLIGSCFFSFVGNELITSVFKSCNIFTLCHPLWEFIPAFYNSGWKEHLSLLGFVPECFQLEGLPPSPGIVIKFKKVILNTVKAFWCLAHTDNLEGDVLPIPKSQCSLNGCAMSPTLFKTFNITSVENLYISYHFKR